MQKLELTHVPLNRFSLHSDHCSRCGGRWQFRRATDFIPCSNAVLRQFRSNRHTHSYEQYLHFFFIGGKWICHKSRIVYFFAVRSSYNFRLNIANWKNLNKCKKKQKKKIFSASLWNKSSRATRRNNLQEHKQILHLCFLRRTPFLTQCVASIHRWGDQTLNRIQNASTDLSLSVGQYPQSTYAHKPAAFEIHFFNWPRHRLDAYAEQHEKKIQTTTNGAAERVCVPLTTSPLLAEKTHFTIDQKPTVLSLHYTLKRATTTAEEEKNTNAHTKFGCSMNNWFPVCWKFIDD